MKKLLFSSLLCIIGLLAFISSAQAQQTTISAKTVQATVRIILRGNEVDSFSKDMTFISNSDLIVPTQKAIKAYIQTKLDKADSTLVYYSSTQGVRLIRGSRDTMYAATIVGAGGVLANKSSDSSKVTLTLNTGQTTLVTGTKAIPISGLTSGSRAFGSVVSQSGAAATVGYIFVCTTNTLTISAVTNAGNNTVNTSDASVINWLVSP